METELPKKVHAGLVFPDDRGTDLVDASVHDLAGEELFDEGADGLISVTSAAEMPEDVILDLVAAGIIRVVAESDVADHLIGFGEMDRIIDADVVAGRLVPFEEPFIELMRELDQDLVRFNRVNDEVSPLLRCDRPENESFRGELLRPDSLSCSIHITSSLSVSFLTDIVAWQMGLKSYIESNMMQETKDIMR